MAHTHSATGDKRQGERNGNVEVWPEIILMAVQHCMPVVPCLDILAGFKIADDENPLEPVRLLVAMCGAIPQLYHSL